ncbi:MAG: hypothetical protein AAF363_22370 [Bacteroidota bacterium]
MRLGQLSRKLVKKPSEIVDFLFEQGIFIDQNSNAKVSEEALEAVFAHFDPEGLYSEQPQRSSIPETDSQEIEITTHEPISEEKEELFEKVELTAQGNELEENHENEKIEHSEIEQKVQIDQVIIPEIKDEALEEKVELTVSQILEQEDQSSESDFDEQNESNVIIKPEKVSLPGLKVLGKIDIPEPKPKQEKMEETSEDEQSKDKRKPRGNRSSNRNDKRQAKEVDFETKRKREEKKYERQKKALEKKKKEQKRRFYEEQVKSKLVSTPKKVTKVKNQEKIEPAEKPILKPKSVYKAVKQPEKAKNVFQKFWKWLNT